MRYIMLLLTLLTFSCASEVQMQDDAGVVQEPLLGVIYFSSAANKLGVTLRYQQVPGTGQYEALTTPVIYKLVGTKQVPVVSLRYADQAAAYHDLCNQMSFRKLTNFDRWPYKVLDLTNFVVSP